jgi:hypothetical protein
MVGIYYLRFKLPKQSSLAWPSFGPTALGVGQGVDFFLSHPEKNEKKRLHRALGPLFEPLGEFFFSLFL